MIVFRGLGYVCLAFVLAASCRGATSPSQDEDSIERNLTDEERITYEDIKAIHMHLDDDRSGNVDHTESAEFVLDELKDKDRNRHTNFHGNDSLISVNDLWASWRQSEVHNWTEEHMLTWLVNTVKLPQYATTFKANKVDGKLLPHLAVEGNGFMSKQLGIINAKHRKKISLRAADVVLFGPNAQEYNYIKDISLFILLFLATAAAWYAMHEKKQSRHQMEQMMKDVDCLQQAEQDLLNLQEKLALAEEEQLQIQRTKLEMESKLKQEIVSAKHQADRLHRERELQQEDQLDIQLLEEELHETKQALAKVEAEADMFSLKSPRVLQQWLQMTYKKEGKHFHQKKMASLRQMEEAKSACDKISKKRNTLLGSFRLAQGQSIDEVDHKILSARSALAEVTNDLQERQHRWQQIEMLCGFTIATDNASMNGLSSAEGTDNSVRRSSIALALASCGNVGGIGTIPSAGGVPNTEHSTSQMTGKREAILQRVLSTPTDNPSQERLSSRPSSAVPRTASFDQFERKPIKTIPSLCAVSSMSDNTLLKQRSASDGEKSQTKANRNTWCVGADPSFELQNENASRKLARDSNENVSSGGSSSPVEESSKKKGKKMAKLLSRMSSPGPGGEQTKDSDDGSSSTRSGSLKRGSLLTKFRTK